MAPRTNKAASAEKSLPSVVNQAYFSDYFLSYRLDAGLDELYKRWDAAERKGDRTARSRVRGLSNAFDKFRVDAALTSPDGETDDGRLDLGILSTDSVEALRDLNDEVLLALGWMPNRDEVVTLTSGDKTLEIPTAHVCETSTGLLLLALDGVFATDPSTVVATKTAPAGTLLDPVRVGGKAEGRTALEAAQLIFTADDPPNYLLITSGGSITLLDRDRWGEGVLLAANLDNAVARNDDRAKGELSAIAALFSADAIDPDEDAQSILTALLDKAANESAGVSKELRHGVRRSVELLANAVVRDIRHRQKGAWRQIDPDDLTLQSLRYLYRVIVLLFAEARPELGILPVDDPDYQAGYSLARLRETALTELHDDRARESTHLQQSLAVLFRLVNDGYEPEATLEIDARGLTFPGLGSTLFSERACPLLDRSRITDETLQQVLANLCFSKEQRGRSRQALSYATLGINQLGAVYEGLMAYKGFLATEELFEIANDGDPDNGSWVIPVDRAKEFPDDVFLVEGAEGQERPVRYREGDFVFRLSGRDRQRSASYYTPEVLTEFTVRHTLDVYWEEHPDLAAADVLELTVCEPALGSGAFLNEAIIQLAERYLKAAQDEAGEIIDPDQYQLELQKTKAHFAINQCYGVDLNPTAVELAEVSLWLNCMYPGLRAPHFGARLRRGNSLIGARRAVYTVEQAKKQPWKGTNRKPAVAPTEFPFDDVPLGEASGIHHFLLPGEGWGIAASAGELKGVGGKHPRPGLAEQWSETVRAWRKRAHAVPTKHQLDRLQALARRVDRAWATAAQDGRNYLRANSRAVNLWGRNSAKLPSGGSGRFNDPEGPSARLRLLMDAWCALWMWGPANGSLLPSVDAWIEAGELLLGQPDSADTGELFTPNELADGTLESVESFGRASVVEVIQRHPWLRECRNIAADQAFFHWELEQPTVFDGGGFELQVGNPPWVRPRWSDDFVLAEYDPFFGVAPSITQEQRIERRGVVLAAPAARKQYMTELAENEGLNDLLGAGSREPLLVGRQNNLYLLFITNSWRRQASGGVTALLHPEGFLSDPKAAELRATAYRRYRRHYHFINELMLFAEISDTREYGVHVYSSEREDPSFTQAAFLYHPSVVDRSIGHDGTGELPGRKLPAGGWDLRPHAERFVEVDAGTLSSWAALLAYSEPPSSPVIKNVTSAEAAAAEALGRHSHRLGSQGLFWTRGVEESAAERAGLLEQRTDRPAAWTDVVLQGPHFGISNPFQKEPRLSGLHQQDYDEIDLNELSESHIPRTNWQRKASRSALATSLETWDGIPYSESFRAIVRKRIPSNTYRSLFVSLCPRGPIATNICYFGGYADETDTALLVGVLSGLLSDFFIRITDTTDVTEGVIGRLPAMRKESTFSAPVLHRVARLNCLTDDFADLWSSLHSEHWTEDDFADSARATRSIASPPTTWDMGVPVRTDLDRWLLLTELDALGALVLGVDPAGLTAVYNSQFPVLRAYEHQMVFDAKGRQLCGDWHQHGFLQAQLEAQAKEEGTRGWVRVWDRVSAYLGGDRDVDLGPFEPPFTSADRVEAMTSAYDVFVERYGLDPATPSGLAS